MVPANSRKSNSSWSTVSQPAVLVATEKKLVS
jgi:hypothetical protein